MMGIQAKLNSPEFSLHKEEAEKLLMGITDKLNDLEVNEFQEQPRALDEINKLKTLGFVKSMILDVNSSLNFHMPIDTAMTWLNILNQKEFLIKLLKMRTGTNFTIKKN
jgi:hypothetical protein